MRVYYSNTEHETGKHKILRVWAELLGVKPPDDYIKNFSVVTFDEFYNRDVARRLIHNDREDAELPDRFYIDNSENIVNNDTDEVVTINPNPQKESYKLSQLYGLTHEQLDTYIDNNMTDLQSAREIVRKALHVILWLVKQTKLDE